MMKNQLLLIAISLALTTVGYAQTAEELKKGDTANVLNYGMDYGQQRYSTLDQINKKTVKSLTPVWNLSLDDNRAQESQAMVYNGVLYITTHAATIAVDAKTGKQIWKTAVTYPPETPRIVCCGIINRGAALYEGKVFRTTLDANVIALDAKTGKELWKQKVIDWNDGYSQTLAPLVAGGVLLTGISGAEYGIRGFIDGWEPTSGKHLWRTYTIAGPDDPGAKSWPGDTWKHGAARLGSPAPMIRSSILSIGEWGMPDRGTPWCVHRATICTRPRCWRLTRRRARSNGTSSSRQTIFMTTTLWPT